MRTEIGSDPKTLSNQRFGMLLSGSAILPHSLSLSSSPARPPHREDDPKAVRESDQITNQAAIGEQ
jgi:hypothetical protein